MNTKDHKNKNSLAYQLATFKFAWQGLRYFFETELKASLHLIAAILAIGFGIFLKISVTEWMMVAFAIGIVIIAEIANTAIELLVDLISPDQNKKAGITKDLAASAVLVASITALVIGLFIYLPKMLVLLKLLEI
jgi:diacylglycerol kinase